MNASDPIARLERQLGRLLVAGVLSSAALLSVGLVMSLVRPGGRASTALLNGGLIVLMATPLMRVAVSLAEYVRMKDWLFVATTVIVLAELTATVMYALSRL